MSKTPGSAGQSAAPSRRVAAGPTVPLQIDAAAATASPLLLRRFQEQLGDIISRELPLSVRVDGLGSGLAATELLQRTCDAVAARAGRYAATTVGVELVIDARALLPEHAWSVRQAELGAGPLYLLASDPVIRARPGRQQWHRQFWQQMWGLRAGRFVRLASAQLARSQTPLLADEPATTILPRAALQVPAGSAWATHTINLSEFANTKGVLDRTRLRSALHQAIDCGLAVHEQADWPTAAMREDSWLNRRLAVYIAGIGDLVVRRREDPGQLACLRRLRKTLRWIRFTLTSRSRLLGTQSDTLPAISRFDPRQIFRHGHEQWERRWCKAVAEHATVTRNLLAMSQWSVFPTHADPDPGFMNLLPLLDFADTCAFPQPLQLATWNVKDFMQLHQRTWAVLQQRRGAHRFAVQV